MKAAQLNALRPVLIGRIVVLTARQPARSGYPQWPDQTFIGRLIAIGQKIDQKRTVCIAVDATALGDGVPIVALRAVAELRAATRQDIHDAITRYAADRNASALDIAAARAALEIS